MSDVRRWSRRRIASGAVAGLILAEAALAVLVPAPTEISTIAFRAPELLVADLSAPTSGIAGPELALRAAELVGPAAAGGSSRFDRRTGSFSTLVLSRPLVPGRGVGNRLVGPAEPLADASPAAAGRRAAEAFYAWIEAHRDALGIDSGELPAGPRVTVFSPDFIQIFAPRRVAGLPVRDSFVQATVRYGNLVLVGIQNWGEVPRDRRARLSESEAAWQLARFVAPFDPGSAWKLPELAWVPVAADAASSSGATVPALDYRLVWVLRQTFGEEGGRFEALVDAEDGEILAIEDTRQFAATPRRVQGGVFPVSNDGVSPDGIEQAGWPMSYVDVATPAGPRTADVGGNLPACVDGTIQAALSGPYVAVNDACGASTLSGAASLDFGTSGGTNCTVPAGLPPGDTHAARTTFFELNQLGAMARSQLPNNAWLQEPLVVNVNINLNCNAYWNGASLNFYRSGGGCANTGEIASLFDHEWGHGLDSNSGNPAQSSPNEGIADAYSALRLDDSCIGRNFTSSFCSGYGNPCSECRGIREVDFAKHVSGQPSNVTSILSLCPAAGTLGPCNREHHCEAALVGETLWDLWNRDLLQPPFAYSRDVARELATQLTYRGAAPVANWYSCNQGSGGCGASGGYLNFLAADDDDGTLANGTPHMTAIFTAFARHGIACSTPTVQNSGCSGAPTAPPAVTTTVLDRGVALSWTASAGASGYRVYRTDGVFACSFGKVLVAETAGTSFLDEGLQNGRLYSYQVVPMGSADECFSVASNCTSVTPAAGASISAEPAEASLELLSGDGDPMVDNCERVRVRLPIANVGTGMLQHVRVVAVTTPGLPDTEILTTFPHEVAPTLASCAEADATFELKPRGLSPGLPLVVDVDLASDELGPIPKRVRLTFPATEGDLQHFASRTFGFEADPEGWTTVTGTFQREATGGGAGGSIWYLHSSNALDSACDVVRSPVVRLAATSTLSLSTRYSIESGSLGEWYDRANFGWRELGSNERTPVIPSGGRLYTASGPGAGCGLGGEAGWAGTAESWAASSWTPVALQSAAFAGRLLQLEARYGTDGALSLAGFRFDGVTLTDADFFVPDASPDSCPSPLIFVDGFSSGDSSAWSQTVP